MGHSVIANDNIFGRAHSLSSKRISVRSGRFIGNSLLTIRYMGFISNLSAFIDFWYATPTLVASVLLHLMKINVCFSAHTSKRIAKVIIVVIWFLALSLAAPMAMSWEVILEDELDPGMCFKLHVMTCYQNTLYVVSSKVTFCLSHRVRTLKLVKERVKFLRRDCKEVGKLVHKLTAIVVLNLVNTDWT